MRIGIAIGLLISVFVAHKFAAFLLESIFHELYFAIVMHVIFVGILLLLILSLRGVPHNTPQSKAPQKKFMHGSFVLAFICVIIAWFFIIRDLHLFGLIPLIFLLVGSVAYHLYEHYREELLIQRFDD